MKKLLLEFAGETSPELIRIQFEDLPLRRMATALRGRESQIINGCSGFAWSSAVKAFAILMLRVVSERIRGGQNAPVLKGYRQSLASSLDNAICKQPRWIINLFGCDQNGSSNLRRILAVRNSGMKQAGPVSVTVQHSAFQELEILALWEGKRVIDLSELETLLLGISVSAEAWSANAGESKNLSRMGAGWAGGLSPAHAVT